jgi:hypothetical protein
MKPMLIYTIWRDIDGDLTLFQGMSSPKFHDGTEQSPGAVMVKEFLAPDWQDAVRRMHMYHEQRSA